MKTSAAGRAALTQREGRRLVAYRDSRGIPTIGVGHVDMTPPKTVMGMRITAERADELLAADLGKVEAVINTVKVPLTQNEFDAMASLGFNIGVGGLRGSSVIRKLNLGDVPGAADAFLAWSKPAVLVTRRKAERLQFLTPDAAAPTVAAARAKVLAARASAARGQASSAEKASVALVAAAVPATAAPHHWALGLEIGAAVFALAIGVAVFAMLRASAAGQLARHAGTQADAAAAVVPT